MKALILNSGMGKRMGEITSEHPKCMTPISETDTILSRQLKQLYAAGFDDFVITTGPFEQALKDHCVALKLPINFTFVNNPIYDQTNYIYSIYLARAYLCEELVLMHGDLVLEDSVLKDLLAYESAMVVSSTQPLPEKDFKAVLKNGKVAAVGVNFFENAVAAQPLYKLSAHDWQLWLKNISAFCERGETGCYAENALNEIGEQLGILPFDAKDRLCREIDTVDDLNLIKELL